VGFNRRGRVFYISRFYGFYRGRQLDGTVHLGPRYGSYCLTAARIEASWGLLAEHRWPYPRGHVIWPPQEPTGLDRIARFDRRFSHFRIRTLEDAKMAIYANGPFKFSVPITAAWRRSKGIIDMPKGPNDLGEGHAVDAVGYDDNTELIHFANSWGAGWGDKGYGFLPYTYFSRYCSDAWFLFPPRTDHLLPDRPPGADFGLRLTGPFQNALGHPSVIIDIWDFNQDIRMGWCIMTLRDGHLDIEDLFVRPDYYGTEHQILLQNTVLDFAEEQNDLDLRLWIAHADTQSRAGNFRTINDFLRASGLTPRRSPFPWAAYLAS
jgi:hypothetical protein